LGCDGGYTLGVLAVDGADLEGVEVDALDELDLLQDEVVLLGRGGGLHPDEGRVFVRRAEHEVRDLGLDQVAVVVDGAVPVPETLFNLHV